MSKITERCPRKCFGYYIRSGHTGICTHIHLSYISPMGTGNTTKMCSCSVLSSKFQMQDLLQQMYIEMVLLQSIVGKPTMNQMWLLFSKSFQLEGGCTERQMQINMSDSSLPLGSNNTCKNEITFIPDDGILYYITHSIYVRVLLICLMTLHCTRM